MKQVVLTIRISVFELFLLSDVRLL